MNICQSLKKYQVSQSCYRVVKRCSLNDGKSTLSYVRCSDITETCHRFLDLTGPLQLGSLPSLHTEYQLRNVHFVGCMRDLYVDGKLIDMNDHAWNSDTLEGCPQKTSFCESAPCRNGGKNLSLVAQVSHITL